MILRSSTTATVQPTIRLITVVVTATISYLTICSNHVPSTVLAWTSSSSSCSTQAHQFFHSQRRNDAFSTRRSSFSLLSAVPTVRRRTSKTIVEGKVSRDDSDDDFAMTSLLQSPRSATLLSMKSSSDETVTTPASGGDVDVLDPEKFLIPFLGLIGTIVAGICIANGVTMNDITSAVSHPQETIRLFIETLKEMGPIGIVYFGMFYLIAETLAVPATPLALSAGYLFGFGQGFTVVLAAATAAACIGFVVGKTFLRSYVETILQQNPKFAKIDRAVGQKGFKLLVLVRLSPIFPFSISNYIYGASSIDFVSYFWGTLLGFTPSTLAYVYTGMVGKEVMFGTADGQPWYVYAAGFTVLLTLLKLVTDVASGIIEAIDDDDDIATSI